MVNSVEVRQPMGALAQFVPWFGFAACNRWPLRVTDVESSARTVIEPKYSEGLPVSVNVSVKSTVDPTGEFLVVVETSETQLDGVPSGAVSGAAQTGSGV